MRVIDGTELTVLDEWSHAFFPQLIAQLLPIVAFVGSEAAQLAGVAAGELPVDLSVVTFLGRTMNVKDGLRGCIDESSCFECLNVIICPTAVVLACVFAVEKRCIDGGTT